jgi:hypothetical protein
MIRKHSGMSLLQSDFSRHSLVNLLGPVELRVFNKSHARISPSHTKYRPMYTIVLKQSSGPTPSGSLEGKHRCGETMFGGSKGVCPFGRRTFYGVREGEAESRKWSEASVGRGKAELFPLQRDSVRLNLLMSLHPSLNALRSYLNCLLPHKMEKNQ